MSRLHTKLLVLFSFIIIFSGIAFVLLGLNSKAEQFPSPQPTPHVVENIPVATSSTPFDSTQDGSLTAGTSAIDGVEGERALVTKVIDGDTMEIEGGKTIRFIGIDTPETVDPRKSVQCFGKEASSETKSLLSGKTVILQKDVSETDKYGRLLRYIYLPPSRSGQILFVNDYLVREGFARVLTYPPDVKYNEQFREAEKEAKAQKKGLWGRC